MTNNCTHEFKITESGKYICPECGESIENSSILYRNLSKGSIKDIVNGLTNLKKLSLLYINKESNNSMLSVGLMEAIADCSDNLLSRDLETIALTALDELNRAKVANDIINGNANQMMGTPMYPYGSGPSHQPMMQPAQLPFYSYMPATEDNIQMPLVDTLSREEIIAKLTDVVSKANALKMSNGNLRNRLADLQRKYDATAEAKIEKDFNNSARPMIRSMPDGSSVVPNNIFHSNPETQSVENSDDKKPSKEKKDKKKDKK